MSEGGTVNRRVVIDLELRSDPDAARNAKRTADEVLRERKRIDKESGRLSDAEIRRIERFERTMRDALRNTSKRERSAHDDRMSQIREEQQARDRAQREFARHSQARIDADRAALEASKKTVGGIIDIAEGLATLGIVGEENLEKVARSFLKIRAGFQVLRGGIDVVTSLAEGMKALQASTAAAAGAQEALNAAQARGAVTGGGRVAGGGLLASLLPVGQLLGTVTAGGYIGEQISNRLDPEGQGTFGGIGDINENLGGSGLGFLDLLRSVGVGPETTGVHGGRFQTGLNFDLQELYQRQDERFSGRDQERQAEFARQQIARLQAQSGLRSRFLTGRLSQIERAGGITGLSDDDILRQQALATTAARDQAQARFQETQGRQFANPELGAARELSAAQEVADTQERLFQIEQRRAQLAQQNIQTRQQAVTLAQQELDRAKQLVETERQRVDSAQARFGRLSRGEQNRLRTISERLQGGGELNEQDARFLEATGLGTGRAQQFFSDRGAAAGGRDVLAGLGELDGLRDAQREASLAQQRLAVQNERLREAMERQTEIQERVASSFSTLDESIGRLSQILQNQQGLNGTGFGNAGGELLGSVQAVAAQNQRFQQNLAAAQQ